MANDSLRQNEWWNMLPACSAIDKYTDQAITERKKPQIILVMGAANESRRYIVTSSLIGCAHTQNDPSKRPSILHPQGQTMGPLLWKKSF